MNITTATRYAANFYLRGDYDGEIMCAIWSNTTNSMLGNTTFTVSQTEDDGLKLYQQTFTPFASAPDEKNTFHLTFDGATVADELEFPLVSLAGVLSSFFDTDMFPRAQKIQLMDLCGLLWAIPIRLQSSMWRLEMKTFSTLQTPTSVKPSFSPQGLFVGFC